MTHCHRHTNCRLGWSIDDGAKSMELKKLGMTQEHEDRDKDQGDKMGRNEMTRLMFQLLNPLKGTNVITSIYTSFEIDYL